MTNPDLATTVKKLHKQAQSDRKSEGVRAALSKAEFKINSSARDDDNTKLVEGIRAARKAQREALKAGDSAFAEEINNRICQYLDFDQLEQVEQMGRRA